MGEVTSGGLVKVCPKCAQVHEKGAPECILCGTSLLHVQSTQAPEAKKEFSGPRLTSEDRKRIANRQLRRASFCYVLVQTLLAVLPGLVREQHILGLFAVSAFVVAVAVHWNYVGQASTPLLQGVLSMAILLAFGLFHPFIPFMLLGHITVASLYWHWADGISSLNH